jgi:hypothetical protein
MTTPAPQSEDRVRERPKRHTPRTMYNPGGDGPASEWIDVPTDVNKPVGD